jgi:hypothetical protein
MSRFRVKRGEIEVEYEGPDSDKKYDAAIHWVESLGGVVQPTSVVEKKRMEEGKVDKRGGQRSAVIGPAVDKLIDDGWLDEHRAVTEIVSELKSKGTPGVTNENVNTACMRRAHSGKLDTILDGSQRVFWAKKKVSP